MLGKSLNSCVPHGPHLWSGANNTLHLPTSQRCCEGSWSHVWRFKPLGRGVTQTTFYSLLCFVCVKILGQGNSTSGQQQPPSFTKAEQMKRTQRHSRHSVIIPLCELAGTEIFCWKNLGNIFTNHQQLQMVFTYVCLQKRLSCIAWTHTGMLSFIDSWVLRCPCLIYLEGIKLSNMKCLTEVKGKVFDWFL